MAPLGVRGMCVTKVEITGRFWDVAVGTQADGIFEVEEEGKPCVQVLTPIMTEKSVVREVKSENEYSVTYKGDAASIVADFQPRTIYGESEDGRKISLLRAQGGYRDSRLQFGTGQLFRAQYAIVGAHVDLNQKYFQARYSVEGLWVNRLMGAQARFESIEGGEVSIYEEDGLAWLQFEIATGGRIREYGDMAFLPFQTLSSLALGKDLRASSVQMKLNSDSPWLDFYATFGGSALGEGREIRPLLKSDQVTIEHAVAWMKVSERAEGLVDAVAGLTGSGPIESQAITCTAIAEGVHRKLYRDSVRFPGLSKQDRKTVMEAVRTTAKATAQDALKKAGITGEDQDIGSLDGILNQFGDVNYRQRLGELSQIARSTYPQLLDAFKDWPKSVATVRNSHVHQLDDAKKDKLPKEDLEVRREQLLDLTLAVVYSVPWVLKLVFFHEAGISSEVIAAALSENRNFEFDMENISSFLSEHPEASYSMR